MSRTREQLADELRKRINDAGPGMKVRETMRWVIECAGELPPGLIDEVAALAGADKHRMRDALNLAPFVKGRTGMASEPPETTAEIDKCCERIREIVASLESLSRRLSALKEPLAAMDDKLQSHYAVDLYHIASDLRRHDPHLDIAEQGVKRLETVVHNSRPASS